MKRILALLAAAVAIFSVYGGEGKFRMIFNGKNTRLFQGDAEMDFMMCLRGQLQMYPEMEGRDILKLIYQSSYGAAHALKDPDAAGKYFRAEFARAAAVPGRLFEVISPDMCRVDIRAWKSAGLPEKWLFNMFIATAEDFPGGRDLFQANLLQAQKILSPEKFSEVAKELELHGENAPHHSEKYRKLYNPSYRLVSTRFIPLFPVLAAAVKVPEKPVRVIAIDGKAASGKSTLARQLSRVLGAGIIHMDDFFLPVALRSAERLAQPGGNVHYERFLLEVLPFLRSEKDFSYRIFDCKRKDYYGKRAVAASSWRVVEGAYSLHPLFQDYADLKIFYDIAPGEQLRRIRQRNGGKAAEVFAGRWIPLEEKHIRQNRVMERADLILGR